MNEFIISISYGGEKNQLKRTGEKRNENKRRNT